MNTEAQKRSQKKYREEHPDRVRVYLKKWRMANKDKERKAARAWDSRNRKRVAESKEDWKRNNPDKAHAHRLAKKRIPLKAKCEICGHTAEHRHHPDYSKPLLVVHVCRACHDEIHRSAKGGE